MGIHSKIKGFTIVELIVVLLIVGILSSVATVAYQKYAMKTKMAESYVGINALVNTEATYYLSNKEFQSYSSVYSVTSLTNTLYANGYYYMTDMPYGPRTKHPFSSNTKVTFYYQAAAGKNNSSGTPLTLSKYGDGFTTGGIPAIWGANNNWCDYGDAPSGVPGVVGKANYTYVIVIAGRDFDKSNSTCTRVHKLVDVSDNGHMNVGNAFQVYNVGD